jgi:hypothetical protein
MASWISYAERQAFLLFRSEWFHTTSCMGMPVPLDCHRLLFKGLDEDRFLKEGWHVLFLPDQVNEYDMARSTMEVESIQFSLFVSDEKSAIGWLYQQLGREIREAGGRPMRNFSREFMQELKAVDKTRKDAGASWRSSKRTS